MKNFICGALLCIFCISLSFNVVYPGLGYTGIKVGLPSPPAGEETQDDGIDDSGVSEQGGQGDNFENRYDAGGTNKEEQPAENENNMNNNEETSP